VDREAIDDYARRMTTAPPAFLETLDAQTRATQSGYQMLTGPLAARLLDMLVWATGAKLVLEVGTFTGYSALMMAGALGDGGRLITCELDPERAAFAREHIAASPHAGRIEIRVGPALETIASLDGPFDLVFIDADKTGYPAYFDALLPKLAPRGLIVLDNMLRGGAVLETDPDPGTLAIRELSERLVADPALTTVLLPVRDGMTIVRRTDPAPGPPPPRPRSGSG
jgi:caffeoyl-CoA O-methyltransferase